MFVIFEAAFFPRFLALHLILIVVEKDFLPQKAVLLGEGEEGRHGISPSRIDKKCQSAFGKVRVDGDE